MYVSAEQLRDNDYVLSMNRYIVHDVADGMAFGDVIKRITRGAQLNAKALDEITTTVPTDMLISELLLVALIIREMFSALSSFTLLPSTKSSEASTKRTPLLLKQLRATLI